MNIKMGLKTSEFWLTAIAQIIGLLVLTGKITPDQGVSLQTTAGQLINSLIDLVTASYMLFSLVTYIMGRTELKKAHITGGVTEKKDITISNTNQPTPPPQIQ